MAKSPPAVPTPAPVVAPPALPAMDAPGQSTPDAPPLAGATLAEATTAYVGATAAEDMEFVGRRLSPAAVAPVPGPLPAVQLFGTKSSPAPDVAVTSDVFDRVGIIDKLLTHPLAEVRQRAAEAKVAIHHGAADIGIKVRAAIDTARAAEPRR